MPDLTRVFSPTEPDPELLDALANGARLCLVAVEVFTLLAICGWLIPAASRVLIPAGAVMHPIAAFCVLLSAFSFQFSEARHSRRLQLLGLAFAVLAALFATLIFLDPPANIFALTGSVAAPMHAAAAISPGLAGGFMLLGLALILLHTPRRPTRLLADVVVLALCFLVLVLISREAFHALPSLGLPADSPTPMLPLICLVLLTWVAILRQAQHSVFSVFLGRGIGGRIARFASPVLLILPFLRETARIKLIGEGRVPPTYITAIVTSLASMLSLGLLLFIAWRITKMEQEIHDLSLRDALTGLYNLRGFHLLAEKSLRLAQRTQMPFSVLYIDVDNLKQINDAFGHKAGSAILAEAADLLRHTFRESDIISRIGGDEFAVAGQFSEAAISVAVQRLRESAAVRNAETGQKPQLAFSLGRFTSEAVSRELLPDLLSRADDAMYEEKRRKKAQLA